MKKNRFEEFNKEDLLRICLEQEDELQKLRPKPAKFKVGQVVAIGHKNSWMNGQPAVFFQILNVEHKNGEWHYAYATGPGQTFMTYLEKHLRALTPSEIEGLKSPPEEAQPSLAIAEPISITMSENPSTTNSLTPGAYTGPGVSY